MKPRGQKVLFMMTPGRRHLIVELDKPYSRQELAVMLSAFRRRLLSEESPGRTARKVDQIVGPGFVIEMLGNSAP